VLAAAKFTTRSTADVHAAMELISTMHRPYGLMHKAVSDAANSDTQVFKWCVWEVIERCRDRSCSQCPLDSDCQGKAKNADGYLKIDDCIAQMRRASRPAGRPKCSAGGPHAKTSCSMSSTLPFTFVRGLRSEFPAVSHAGFWIVNPFVCLWIQVDGPASSA